MKSTLGAFIIVVALIAVAGAASAMPSADDSFTWETVFEPGG